MEEKVLIQNEKNSWKKFFIIMGGIGGFFALILLIFGIKSFAYGAKRYSEESPHLAKNIWGDYYVSDSFYHERYSSAFGAGFGESFGFFLGAIGAVALFLGIAFLIYKAWSKMEITVTDKRIYGKAVFGKRVDLPFDMISAVSTSWLHGIGVATSSGVIKFKFIPNNVEIHSAISKQLINRQTKDTAPQQPVAAEKDTANELQKFKKLLDDGIISQEEFDAKKKQLLGI